MVAQSPPTWQKTASIASSKSVTWSLPGWAMAVVGSFILIPTGESISWITRDSPSAPEGHIIVAPSSSNITISRDNVGTKVAQVTGVIWK